MKTLMYPIAPDDDFPEMFCAIRQGSGEHWFYVPEGESASWMLFRAESENAKLREYVTKLEAANLDVTARLTDYIGQYDPTDAFVAEVKADNVRLRKACAELLKIAKRHDPEWLHWPEMHEELRKLGVDDD